MEILNNIICIVITINSVEVWALYKHIWYYKIIHLFNIYTKSFLK